MCTKKIRPATPYKQPSRMDLPDVDGSLRSLHTVVVVTGISLSIRGGNGLVFGDRVASNVAIVGLFQGGGVLGADGGKDGVRSSNGSVLLGLVSGIGTRVEQDKGTLFGGDGTKVTLGNGALEGGDSGTVMEASTLLSGGANGTIGRSDGGDGNQTGSGDGPHGSTAVHV